MRNIFYSRDMVAGEIFRRNEEFGVGGGAAWKPRELETTEEDEGMGEVRGEDI